MPPRPIRPGDKKLQAYRRLTAHVLAGAYNCATSGKSPALTGCELAELGFKLAVIPTLAVGAAVHGMREMARVARETGHDAHLAATGFTVAGFFDMVGMREWR